MPFKCCVPGCRGNYDANEKVSVFKFPSEPEKRDLWLRKIPRVDYQPSRNSFVCVRHFSDQFIIKTDSVTRSDGTVLSVERTRPKLTPDAYPSIFTNPSCPSYLTAEPPVKRRKPDQRREELQKRDENAFSEWLETDKINCFSDFSTGVKERLAKTTTWLCRLHSYERPSASSSTATVGTGVAAEGSSSVSESYWSFYFITDNSNTIPSLASTFRVFSDMHVEVFAQNRKYFYLPTTVLVLLLKSCFILTEYLLIIDDECKFILNNTDDHYE